MPVEASRGVTKLPNELTLGGKKSNAEKKEASATKEPASKSAASPVHPTDEPKGKQLDYSV